jgi:phenylalanyl-tRNA synthetase alpha chain
LESLAVITDQSALDAWRVANVGRSSPLMQVFAGFGKLSKEEKPVVGAEANRVKVALESALTERAEAVKNAALAKSLEEEKLDVTLPGRSVNRRQAASIHAAIAPRVGHSRGDGFSGVHLARGGDG